MRLLAPDLILIPQTLALAEAELRSPADLAERLGATVPEGWPPGEYDRDALLFFRDQLRHDPGLAGWLSWYALRPESPAVLVGACGFMGPPEKTGCVEMGFSVLPQFRNQGIATTMARLLSAHAMAHPGMERVQARTGAQNAASQAVLRKAGFRALDSATEDGLLLFVSQRNG